VKAMIGEITAEYVCVLCDVMLLLL